MRLFYRRGTGRPLRVAWLLGELGVAYEAVAVSADDVRGAEHRARSPLGRVPALELDDNPSGSRGGTTMFDSTAIVLQLADLHPEAAMIGPLGSEERARAYQWSLTAMTELEPAAVGYLRADAGSDSAVASRERFQQSARAFADALAGRAFLIGDRLSVADIVLGGVLGVATHAQLMPDAAPDLAGYYAGLTARPAFRRALEATESLLASTTSG